MKLEKTLEARGEVIEVDDDYRNENKDLKGDFDEGDEGEVRIVSAWPVTIFMKHHASHGDDHKESKKAKRND